jgi:hypothetical protein
MADIATTTRSEAAPVGVVTASPSWVDAVIGLFERLPGPTWLAYLAAMAVGCGLAVGAVFLEPSAPALDPIPIVYYGALPFAVLWLIANLDRTASRALAALRPLLRLSDDEIGEARRTLTKVPARPALAITVFSALITPVGYVVDPVGSGVAGYSIVGVSFRWAWESFVTAIFLILVYHTVRQLRLIGRLHESIGVIDLFDQAPLYALSSVTSTTAIGLILLLVPSVFLIPSAAGASYLLISAAWYAFALVIAIGAFFVPLRGVHGRIAADKSKLRGEIGRRIGGTLEALHRAVDEGDAAGVTAGHQTLTALIAERDLVARIPTWPWSAGALTRFLSAVLLPIGLWLVTRFLERIV